MKYIYEDEFSTVSDNAIPLDFLEKYLPSGDSIHVNPITGFVTSSRSMSAENVAKYWSEIIFPNKSEESYSAYNPFAQARLFYVMQSIAKFLNFNKETNLRICDFATGEGVLLSLLRNNYPRLKISGTEHSSTLVELLNSNGFDVQIKTLGIQTSKQNKEQFDISTLTLMQLAGLEIVFVNRYFDSDVLMIVGKKVSHQVEPKFFDDQMQVVKFMREWALASEFFENLRTSE